jgi:hypothetical protein
MLQYVNGTCKVYLAEFKNKKNNDVFYKIGYTTYKDAMDRFKIKGSMYNSWDIRILSTIYCNDVRMAKLVEYILLSTYPKNFWLEEKISGVTEVFKLERKNYLELLKNFRDYSAKSKSLLGYDKKDAA